MYVALNKFKGMNLNEIKLISTRIHELLRDREQRIEKFNSISEFFSEYEYLIEYFKENRFNFQMENHYNEISSEIIKIDSNIALLKKNFEIISESFYLSLKGLEKLDEILSQSNNLLEKKIYLEKNFLK